MRKFRNVTWKLSTYAAIIHPIPTTHNHVNANGSTFCFLASLNKSIICKRPTVQTLNNDRIKNRIKYTPAVIRTALLFQTSGSVLSIFNNTLNAWKIILNKAFQPQYQLQLQYYLTSVALI